MYNKIDTRLVVNKNKNYLPHCPKLAAARLASVVLQPNVLLHNSPASFLLKIIFVC